MQLIPAIDLHRGECVRLYQGEISKKTVYSKNPEEMAKKWEDCGAEVLHVVDLDGAFEGESKNIESIEKIAAAISIPVQLGGGIRTAESIDRVISLGVSRVVVGTLGYEQPDTLRDFANKYPNQILLGIDAKNMMVAIKGWVDVTELNACDMVRSFAGSPLRGVIYTDIKRDGTMHGPNLESLAEMAAASPFPVIASGGISKEDDIKNISRLGVENIKGVILGKSLYDGTIDLGKAIVNAANYTHSS